MVAAMKAANPTTNDDNANSLGSAVRIQSLSSALLDHVSREEQILIPILGNVLGVEITTTIKKEHERIIELLHTLQRDVLSEETADNVDSKHISIDLAAVFESFLREHFSREDNVLFWFASLHIPKS